MVDSVVSSQEIYEDYAGDFTCFKSIFNTWAVQDLPGRKPACSGKYQALVQFVEVTQKGNWAEAFRA